MTDRQKLLLALEAEPDPHAGSGLSVLDVVAMLERVRDDLRDTLLVAG